MKGGPVMARRLRIAAAIACMGLVTLLFLDFTGTIHRSFGWLAKIQFLPALLVVNVAVVAAILLATFVFGRIYCSVLCPLGVFQDVVSRIAGWKRPHRFKPSPERTILRYSVLAVFILLVILGLGSVFALLAPYSAYGRMVAAMLGPLYGMGNNLLAQFAERSGSYAVYRVDVWLHGAETLGVAIGTFVVLAVLAWRKGRIYCNTICPVGTLLGSVARFSIFRPRIQVEQCTGCGLCARDCKATCIDSANHTVDLSRCVLCLNCLESCRKGAITYACKERHAQNL